jgi:hypothetical protein
MGRFSDRVVSLTQRRRSHERVDVGWPDLRDQRWKSQWYAQSRAHQRFEWRGYSRDRGCAALLQMTLFSRSYFMGVYLPRSTSSSFTISFLVIVAPYLSSLPTYCRSLLIAAPYLLPLLTYLPLAKMATSLFFEKIKVNKKSENIGAHCI